MAAGSIKMGIFEGVKFLISNEGTILTSALTYQRATPNLSFIEALERSLIQCRPGWTQELWDRVAPTIRAFENAPLPQKRIQGLMVAQVVNIMRAIIEENIEQVSEELTAAFARGDDATARSLSGELTGLYHDRGDGFFRGRRNAQQAIRAAELKAAERK